MKQHITMLGFYVKNSFYKVLGVLLLMAAVEGALFYFIGQQMVNQQLAGELYVVTLELIVEKTQLDLVFIVAAVVIYFLLFYSGKAKGSHPEYTLYRLKLTPRSVFLWQVVYCIGCFFLVWVVQAAVAAGLGIYFVKTADPSLVTNQSLYLAFYRNEFLHALLPLKNVYGWITNLLFVIMLGILTAYEAGYARKVTDHMLSAYGVILIGSNWFSRPGLGTMVLAIIIFIVAAGMAGYYVFVKGEWTLDATRK